MCKYLFSFGKGTIVPVPKLKLPKLSSFNDKNMFNYMAENQAGYYQLVTIRGLNLTMSAYQYNFHYVFCTISLAIKKHIGEIFNGE